MATQSFTKNYRDHSTDTGYQFEFFCDKCGSGRRSAFQTSSVGVAASVLRAAGAVFGGRVAGAGWGAQHLKDVFRGPAWDGAFASAIEECRPSFRQCTRCGGWFCPEVCWNHARGLCETCAPDVGEQAVAIQAQVAVEQSWDAARRVDQMRGLDVQSAVAVAGPACSRCQATLVAGAKFCAQCGVPAVMVNGPRFCAECGSPMSPGARFCAGCGHPAA
jgi:hypothetical protein